MIIRLSLRSKQIADLLKHEAQLRRELEKIAFPTVTTVDNLRIALSNILQHRADFQKLKEASLHRSSVLWLSEQDTRIRNLPWQLILDDCPLLSLCKTHLSDLPEHHPTLGLPLKVLVMVSAPEDASRLKYEEEELRLLHALAPLMSRGLAQVHFTDDGSLENLVEKLAENQYHVLHFSGHGAYEKEKGFLLFENIDDGRVRHVSARQFSETLQEIRRRGHCPDLVVLSACQSAQGRSPGDLQGVADELLAGGLPAVVAMSASIIDECATEFTTALYKELAEENPLPDAFNKALWRLREFEAMRFNRSPGQWLIPQLLVSACVEHLYDKNQKPEELKFSDSKYISGEKNLLQFHGGVDRGRYNYVFIGRRRERRLALANLRNTEHPVVLLRGQGGVGKTALAEHLIMRMLAGNPRIKVFIHSEKAPTFDSLRKQICQYLEQEYDLTDIEFIMKKDKRDSWQEQFSYLYTCLKKVCSPVFIFDNVESYQETGGGKWSKSQDVLEGLQLLLEKTKSPILLTGRYPIPELPDLAVCDLNEVGFSDFYRKCLQLPLRRLAGRLQPIPLGTRINFPGEESKGDKNAPTFEDVCRVLHRAFGGNYRALEFFDELYTRRGEAVFGTLERLESIPPRVTKEVRHRMSEDLVFGELLALLGSDETDTLTLLAKFRIPVLPMALGMQRNNCDLSHLLERLVEITLAERETKRDGNRYYYVVPLVKNLLTYVSIPTPAFSEKTAGDYHEEMVRNQNLVKNDLITNTPTEATEAFKWYIEAKEVQSVNRMATRLCKFYYDIQQFQSALEYGHQTEKLAKEKTAIVILSIMAMSYKTLGQLDLASDFLLKYLELFRKIGDREGEARMLYQISQLYIARGEYDTALEYIQKSSNLSVEQNLDLLEFMKDHAIIALAKGIPVMVNEFHLEQHLKAAREIGDRQAECSAFYLFGQSCEIRGEYDRALEYLQQSLEIAKEIGDRYAEGFIMNNIGHICGALGEYEKGMHSLQQSLKIAREIGDRSGEGYSLNNLGKIFNALRMYDKAIQCLQHSLKIADEIEDRHLNAKVLNNIGETYISKNDYITAKDYLKKSLQLMQEIGDLNGTATTLTNMGVLLFNQGKGEESALLLVQAHSIFQQIGSFKVKTFAGFATKLIEKIGNSRFKEIVKFLEESEKNQIFLQLKLPERPKKDSFWLKLFGK